MKGLLLFAAVLVYAQARVGQKCEEQRDCDSGECCQILSEFPIMSKRQLHENSKPAEREGTCQLYKLENARCGIFEKANGYCGCGPGLHCNGTEVKLDTLQPIDRRSIIAARPGYTWLFTCKPMTN